MTFFEKYKKNFLNAISTDRYFFLIEIYNSIYVETISWMNNNNIFFVNLPITTQSISSPMGKGSDSLPYKVKSFYNNFTFYLADSMQFYLELMLRIKKINKVGYISPSFRGEKVDERHLHQFNHFEIEMKGDLKSCKKVAEKYIKHIVNFILQKHGNSNKLIKNNKKNLESFLKKKFYSLSFENAKNILKNEFPNGISINNKILSINSIGENFLMQKFFNKILWIQNFPSILVPFYQKSLNNYAENCDLLIGIGETLGMGERCETYNETIISMNYHKNSPKNYNWYLEMKKEFPMKSSGFGLGIERLVLFLINETDIRNVTIIPRITDEEILP